MRSAAVLGAIYTLALVWLLLTGGCASKEIKTARPGLDAASGTTQTLQGELDTIEYHARELRKGVK